MALLKSHGCFIDIIRMTFCDLAGMERANQTENRGFRLHESGNINNSLTVLLKVIRMLRYCSTYKEP